MSDPGKQSATPQAPVLPEMFQRYGSRIEEGLRTSLAQTDSAVYTMLRYCMGWVDTEGTPVDATQGKLLRPTLCLFASEAAGGSVERAMPAAVALEFIHNFSLIHDEIQDFDDTRHHRPTLWVVWGMPKALTAGNLLRIVADSTLETLVNRGVPISSALGIVSVLTDAYLRMIEGQYLDLSYEGRPDIGMNAYLDMISRKTGALIRCALTMGAMIGTQDDNSVEAFRKFGRSLGYAFQIRDDYLGVWGDEDVTGKPVGIDIRRKKNSFPVVHAMAESKGASKDVLVNSYKKEELDDKDVSDVLTVMDEVRTKETAHELTAFHCDEALESIESVELAPGMRREVEDLVHFLLVREH